MVFFFVFFTYCFITVIFNHYFVSFFYAIICPYNDGLKNFLDSKTCCSCANVLHLGIMNKRDIHQNAYLHVCPESGAQRHVLLFLPLFLVLSFFVDAVCVHA